jgi:hydroxymethylpyrimidine/phosphomethylpyrimidine kinase
VTPNLPEVEALGGVDALRARGARAVLVKGGHALADRVLDHLYDGEGMHVLEGERVGGRKVHGTGCALAAAITANLARGRPLQQAVALARRFVRGKIAAAAQLGQGSRLIF